MFKHLLAATSVALFIGAIALAGPAAAQAKTAKACAEEYKAAKPALKAAKEKKGEFISACRALPVGTSTPIGSAAAAPASPLAPTRTSTVGALKTAGACNDEYKANKGALKDAKEKKKEFIAACRSLAPGTPTPIGTAAAAPAPTPTQAPTAPAPAPQPTAAPAPSRAPTSSTTSAAAAPGESACGNSYAHLPASHTAAQFCDEGQAKSRCPGQAVVWVNTKSKIYHHAGANTYGHTKEGAYMCETDATAEGDRLSKNGH